MKLLLFFLLLFYFNDPIDQEKVNFTKHMVKGVEKISGNKRPQFALIDSISAQNEDWSEGRFYKFYDTHPVAYTYVGRVLTCRSEGCTNNRNAAALENAEFFDYFILFDSTAHILLVSVFNYEASHGHEVTTKSWLKQFAGYNGDDELVVGKNVDAISGATTSVNNITNDLAFQTGVLKQYIRNH